MPDACFLNPGFGKPGPRGTLQPEPTKPGSWLCLECYASNHGEIDKQRCRACGSDRPQEKT